MENIPVSLDITINLWISGEFWILGVPFLSFKSVGYYLYFLGPPVWKYLPCHYWIKYVRDVFFFLISVLLFFFPFCTQLFSSKNLLRNQLFFCLFVFVVVFPSFILVIMLTLSVMVLWQTLDVYHTDLDLGPVKKGFKIVPSDQRER